MEFEIKVVKIDNGIRSDVNLNGEMPVVEMKRIRFKLLAAGTVCWNPGIVDRSKLF